MNAPASHASVRDALQWAYREELYDYGQLLASLGVCLSEAAWRGDETAAVAHVKEARLIVLDAIGAAKKLGAISEAGSIE